MRLYARGLALAGVLVAVAGAKAETAPVDPLSSLQNAFGTIVGDAFTAPDRVAAATAPGAAAALAPPLGGALRTSLQIPGAAFAALVSPLTGIDAALGPPPAPAAPSHPPRDRHAGVHHKHRRA